jgi:hypothetical protein
LKVLFRQSECARNINSPEELKDCLKRLQKKKQTKKFTKAEEDKCKNIKIRIKNNSKPISSSRACTEFGKNEPQRNTRGLCSDVVRQDTKSH